MKQYLKYFFLVFLSLFAFSNCSKDPYLTDNGIHEDVSPLSTYDYLAAHPYHLFDSLLMIIDFNNLKEELNGAKTFFAPTDYSVNRYYDAQLQAEFGPDAARSDKPFDEFIMGIPLDSIRAYLFNDKQYALNEIGTNYTDLNDQAGLGGFAVHKVAQPTAGSWSFSTPYHMFFVKKRGEPDRLNAAGNVLIEEGNEADVRIYCQTTGIKTSSGTLINVLANTHTFINDFKPSPRRRSLTYNITHEAAKNGFEPTQFTIDLNTLTGLLGSPSVSLQTAVGDGVNGSIKFYGLNSKNERFQNDQQAPLQTAGAPGHWFNRFGDVVYWGDGQRIYCEYRDNNVFNIGHVPNEVSRGEQYTIRQSFVANDAMGEIVLTVIFNITIV